MHHYVCSPRVECYSLHHDELLNVLFWEWGLFKIKLERQVANWLIVNIMQCCQVRMRQGLLHCYPTRDGQYTWSGHVLKTRCTATKHQERNLFEEFTVLSSILLAETGYFFLQRLLPEWPRSLHEVWTFFFGMCDNQGLNHVKRLTCDTPRRIKPQHRLNKVYSGRLHVRELSIQRLTCISRKLSNISPCIVTP